MSKRNILIIILIGFNLVYGQILKLTIPETIKTNIDDFQVLTDLNSIILNHQTVINIQSLKVNDIKIPFTYGTATSFVDNGYLVSNFNFAGKNFLFFRSIENNLIISKSIKLKHESPGIYYSLNDSVFLIDYYDETEFYKTNVDFIKLENVVQHAEGCLTNPSQIFKVPFNKNKLSIFCNEKIIIYDYSSKQQVFLFEEDGLGNSVYIPVNFIKVSCSEDGYSKTKECKIQNVLTKNIDIIKLPTQSPKIRPIVINDSIVAVYNKVPYEYTISNQKITNPFCFFINLNSKKIIKTIYLQIQVGEYVEFVNSNNVKSNILLFKSNLGRIILLDIKNYKLNQINVNKNIVLQNSLINGITNGGFKYATGEWLSVIYESQPIQISREDKLIIVNHGDFLSFYDLKSKSEILQIYMVKDVSSDSETGILFKLPNSNYFSSVKSITKKLHYSDLNLKVIGFEQLDPVYNRPDIVLDSIGKYFGNSDGGMIDEYRKSWEKRIDRLGLDKEKLGKGEIAVPNAEIVGADTIAYENKAGKHNIKVSANDPKYPLRRFNVFVNEVPLYGSAGVSIAHLKKQVWDTTVSVPLSVGENKIQVSVMNELGLENFKYPTYVNYTPDKEIVAKTYYIGIGVNEFKESSHNLKYCVKDVRDLAREFASENKNVDTLLFTDQQVTKENILALKDYLNKTGVNDKVIISCSSHGLLDDSLNFYLAMHDVDFNNPKARGLKYEALESLLDGIPARQKLLLLDACNSGENDKTEVLKQELQQKEKNMDSSQVLAARGVIIKLEEENKSNFKKMNELFVNVRNNTGSVIISAAGGQESALEAISVDGKTIENGAFTYSILECLKQNEGKELKVNALKQYAEKRVEEITNGKQKPTSRQETMEVDWGVR
jgi:hypothetical protein